ncbi:LOW QUALITY PROTEIN: hypothetical protein PHMEG_00023540 [Phytophthora megakarya]|uniref:Integrase catalytic domain-containing protein n=1 Tax=Phytophthora megakarya TaxID=4795 RepID=A0A225VJ30_9STRA|nr:LOW QUALITY PROTEIN: hypothetical protein PHMEG_00023540 [Phytophthora megakarya]
MIDQATRWLEVGVQPDEESLTTAESFDREWLCRYPIPRKVVHDQGPEFTGEEFQELLRSYGITAKPITAKNSQADAICERVHLEIENILRCHEGTDWRKVIYYTAFALSQHPQCFSWPTRLWTRHDLTPIARRYLSKRRFNAILVDNDRENDKRLEHFYKPGDQVMLRIPKHFRAKVKRVADGAFPIKTENDNGTMILGKGTSLQQLAASSRAN